MQAKRVYPIDTSTLFVGLISGFIFIGFLDPINWPKQIALVSLAPFLLHRSFLLATKEKSSKAMDTVVKMFLVSMSLALIAAMLSVIFSKTAITRIAWGIWGRNNGIITLISLWVLALSFYWFAKQRDFLKSFFHALEIIGIIFCGYGLIQFFGFDPIKWSQNNQVFSFFGNTNFASAVLSLCASTFLVLLFFESSGNFTLKFLRFILFIVATFLTFETNSIQGLSALLIVFSLTLFIKLDLKRALYKYLYLSISGFAGIVVFVGTLGLGPLGSYIGQYTVQLRYQYWLAGLKIGASSPLFGVGSDSYGDYFRTYRTQEVAERTSIDLITNNAHNVFVQSFATMGLLGLLSVSIPFLFAVYASSRILVTNQSSDLAKAVSAIFLSLWSMAFFSIDNISIAVWNYVFLGVVLALNVNQSNKRVTISLETEVHRNHSRVEKVEPTKYLALTVSALLFGLSWYASYPDRSMQKFLQNPVNPQDNSIVSTRISEIQEIANQPFVMETQYWYLASELNKVNNSREIFEILDLALSKYRRDFNLLDLSAGYREQRGLQYAAITYREGQLLIEERHPRVWLSYAYDLLAAGREKDAQQAFLKVTENQVFLDESFKEELKARATDFGL
jgi:O-antigen ligase